MRNSTRTIYEVKDPDHSRWHEIDEPLPSSIVGIALRKSGDTWTDEHGWQYRRREVPAK